MHEEQVIKDIKVIGVEKPDKGKLQQHFEYVIRVSYVDGYEHIIFRRYSMLFDFHSVLKEVVKDGYGSVIVLPELPVARFQHFGRKFLRLGMNKEFSQMTDFCQKIILLPKFISEKDIILKFFDQLGTDKAHAESYQEESQKGELPKEQSDIPTSVSTAEVLGNNQDNDNQYRSIAEFEAVGTGELSVICGEIVTVIEKNSSGWWLVSNTAGTTGFTPATFLEPLEEKNENDEEWVEVEGPYNIYTAVKDYEAQCQDEISFKAGEELEVISRSNFGWWKVRRRNETGLCPASSLTTKETLNSSDSNYNDDAAMNEFRKSILYFSKKSSTRETPPRKSSTKSHDEDEFSEPGHFYGDVQRPEPERYSPGDLESSVKYTRVIPKHLRPKETSSEKDQINYVNIPVIKDGAPHYFYNSSGQKSEVINVHVVRKDYQASGISLQQGELVQVIAVMPDGCHWKVATMNPPFRDGLVPSDLLCPELPNHMDEPPSPSESTGFPVLEGNMSDKPEPVKVLPRFTQPPSVRKPVPMPRTGVKSPVATGSSRGLAIVAVDDFHPSQSDLLPFKKGDGGRLLNEATSGWWFIELKGFEGWVPTVYWKKIKDINDRTNSNLHETPYLTAWDKSQWFCGKMSRQQCEDHFAKSGKHLEFIVRESIQRVGSYVLSIQFNDKVHHFPIEKTPSGKLNIGKRSFDQLSEIVTHYKVNPLFYTDHRQPVSLGNPLPRIGDKK